MTSQKPETLPLLQSIFDGITDGIMVIDRKFRVVMFNKAMKRFVNQDEANIQDEFCFRICHFNQAKDVCNDCQALSAFEDIIPPSRIRSCFKENGKRQFEIWNFPIRNNDGKVDYIVEYVKDVTEWQKMEKEMMQARRLAIVGEFAAKTTHEIRNPLNIMEGAAHYLLDEYKGEPVLEKYLGMIKGQIERLETFATDMLAEATTRISFGEKRPVSKVLVQAMEEAEFYGKKKEISFELFIDEELPTIQYDHDKINGVLINLLRNACDAVDQKGKVEMICQRRQINGEDYIEINVIDNGKGISKSETKKVFDSFYTTKVDGTGLGLPIVKDIMRSHGGYVFFDSDVGEGSIVSIGLPTNA